MLRKSILFLICLICLAKPSFAAFELKNPFAKPDDTRARDLKYQYDVLKADEKKKMEGKIYNRTPSGYMTVEEYERMSEYKDRSRLESDIPQLEKPSDFKYVPQPLYSIAKYNDPPGAVELSLGKRLFLKRQINAQGIVSPDYSMLVYPAVYYYPDSASVACDLFVIPLDADDNTLQRILKANVAKRYPNPILSTEKAIDNFAAFRTLTPVDFSTDASKLLVKEKIGSSEDGIWQTKAYVYDFNNKVSYDLVEVRDSIVYFWKEYMDLDLDEKRWDIVPLGFDITSPDRVIVQSYAYTGEKPIYLGAWSIDFKGNQSRLVSFRKDYVPEVSINGFKLIKDGVDSYQTVEIQEKLLKEQSKILEKEKKEKDKQEIQAIKNEYKFIIKGLNDDYKEEYRDYRKLQSLSGSTEGKSLEDAYNQYLEDQWKKDIEKTEKMIEKHKSDIDKIDQRIKDINSKMEQPKSSPDITKDGNANTVIEN